MRLLLLVNVSTCLRSSDGLVSAAGGVATRLALDAFATHPPRGGRRRGAESRRVEAEEKPRDDVGKDEEMMTRAEPESRKRKTTGPVTVTRTTVTRTRRSATDQ